MERGERAVSLDCEVEAFCLMTARRAFGENPPEPYRQDALTIAIAFRDEQENAIAIAFRDKDSVKETRFRHLNVGDIVFAAEGELESCILEASAAIEDSDEQIEALNEAYFWHMVAEVAQLAEDNKLFYDMIPSAPSPEKVL